jgi:hypothetical protein
VIAGHNNNSSQAANSNIGCIEAKAFGSRTCETKTIAQEKANREETIAPVGTTIKDHVSRMQMRKIFFIALPLNLK